MTVLPIVVNATAACANERAKSSDDMAAEECIVTVQQIYCVVEIVFFVSNANDIDLSEVRL